MKLNSMFKEVQLVYFLKWAENNQSCSKYGFSTRKAAEDWLDQNLPTNIPKINLVRETWDCEAKVPNKIREKIIKTINR